MIHCCSRPSRAHFLKRGVVLALLSLCIAARAAEGQKAAEEPQIRVVPDTQELVISGVPGSEPSLIGEITLLSNVAVPELIFRASDFHKEAGADKRNTSETIARTQIQVIPSNIVLRADTPQDVAVKFSNLKQPGDYTGSVEFLLPQHGMTATVHLAIRLRVAEAPRLGVRKGSESINVHLVNRSVLGCYLLEKLFKGCGAEKYSLPLDNQSILPFRVTGIAASASGERHHLSTGNAIIIPALGDIPPDPIVNIPFQIERGDLVPDHYVGDFQLRIPEKADPLKIPLEINVSSAPELPVIVLIVGILLGRMIKYMKDKGTPQSDLLRQLLQIQARAAQDQRDLGLLQHMLQQARTDINELRLDSAKSDLALIENRLTLLSRLRYLESLLAPRAADEGVAAVLANIATARNQISLGADPTAIATQIETQVQGLAAPAGVANPAARAIEVAAATSVRGAAGFAAAAPPAVPKATLFRRTVAMLTGHPDALRADITLWFLRPLAWVVLVALLTLTGFIQLYLKNPIFGADAVSDYFGLLVWATGADVAGRTLSNFKG
jgi:hypothetical protein